MAARCAEASLREASEAESPPAVAASSLNTFRARASRPTSSRARCDHAHRQVACREIVHGLGHAGEGPRDAKERDGREARRRRRARTEPASHVRRCVVDSATCAAASRAADRSASAAVTRASTAASAFARRPASSCVESEKATSVMPCFGVGDHLVREVEIAFTASRAASSCRRCPSSAARRRGARPPAPPAPRPACAARRALEDVAAAFHDDALLRDRRGAQRVRPCAGRPRCGSPACRRSRPWCGVGCRGPTGRRARAPRHDRTRAAGSASFAMSLRSLKARMGDPGPDEFLQPDVTDFRVSGS